ncbi:hypothetical protein HID58_013875 [Brassica napus]|uniref:protein-serine/threonine phosphatase n=1 Tax=Brassica napus TaxID=3708 RepID=A0ABQ8DHB4_BRANA|nr:hypothetical protein HID58_013875 [Brassica napus]
MEDEHICVDDLSSQVSCLSQLPNPSAFYAVFDGHGGSEAATYVKQNAIRLFFEDEKFPQTSEVNNSVYVEEVRSSLRNAPINLLERRRVEKSGGVFEDGYLNGELSVTRALGDWDMKRTPRGSSKSPLISEPEIKQTTLTEDDEFLVMACDGIWDVLTSQEAVSIVKRGLNRHDDPGRCARELVMEALRLNTFDNLTAVVVSFVTGERVVPLEKKRCFGLTPEAFRSLRIFRPDELSALISSFKPSHRTAGLIFSLRSIATSDLLLHHLSVPVTDSSILDSLCFPSSPSPSIIAAPLTANASGNCQTSLPCNLKVDVLYFGLICKEVAKVVPAQTLAATNLADQELTETMQKLLIVMQRLDDKIGLMLESDGELFNRRWGFFSRAGLWDKSHLMRQIEKVSNFLNYTPFMYFRSQEQVVKLGRVPLINCAKTSMSSKLISGDSDFFANLVCFHFSSLCSQSISAIEFPSRLWDPFIISCNSG